MSESLPKGPWAPSSVNSDSFLFSHAGGKLRVLQQNLICQPVLVLFSGSDRKKPAECWETGEHLSSRISLWHKKLVQQEGSTAGPVRVTCSRYPISSHMFSTSNVTRWGSLSREGSENSARLWWQADLRAPLRLSLSLFVLV